MERTRQIVKRCRFELREYLVGYFEVAPRHPRQRAYVHTPLRGAGVLAGHIRILTALRFKQPMCV